MSVTQISPKEAFDLVVKDSNSLIIDVRTLEEFNFVGFIDAQAIEERIIVLPWRIYPKMTPNTDFTKALTKIFDDAFEQANREKFKLIFICRSGGRSQEAAENCLALGFGGYYNVVSGFEGDLDEFGHRSKINGWKAENLPWKQK